MTGSDQPGPTAWVWEFEDNLCTKHIALERNMEDTWIKWKGGECWEEGNIKVGRWLLDVYKWWNSWERVPKLVEWPVTGW